MAGPGYGGIKILGFPAIFHREMQHIDLFLRGVDRRLHTLEVAVAAGGGGGGGGGAPSGASYVTMVAEAGLSAERALVGASPITVSDGGPNGNVSVGLAVAAPSGGYASSPSAGSASSSLRSDAVFIYPPKLKSLTGALSELGYSDNSVDATLSAPQGILNINTGTGMSINLGPTNAGSGVNVLPDATLAPVATMLVNLRPGVGTRAGIRSQFFSGDLTTTTVQAWDAVVNPSGVFTGSTISAYGSTTNSLSPTAGSDNNNKFYGLNLGTQFRIANANAGFLEVATGYFKGVTRLIGTPTITVQAGVIIEPPTASTSDQFGLLVRQQTAQATAVNRTGIRIDSQNSGTNRLSLDAQDRVRIVNPSGIAASCLELQQSNTGASAGAHINFSDKGGNPPSPNQGDMWRIGGDLKFFDAIGLTHFLNPLTTKGDLVVHNGTNEVRQAVGADYTVLTARSSQADGVQWLDPASVNGTSVGLPNFGPTPLAPDGTFVDVIWQQDGSTPANVSAYVPEGGRWHTISQDLGTARNSGYFDVTHPGGLQSSDTINVIMSGAPIGAKGSAQDEGEMNMITCYAIYQSATSFRVFWYSDGVMVGPYNFAYSVGQ